jgi:hypothetical protein
VKLTYPNGGEGFVPGTTERIHWDAEGVNGDFELSYSSDNGATYTSIATVPALRRMYDWLVPAGVTAGAVVKVARNGVEDRSDYSFNVAPLSAEYFCQKGMSGFDDSELRSAWRYTELRFVPPGRQIHGTKSYCRHQYHHHSSFKSGK